MEKILSRMPALRISVSKEMVRAIADPIVWAFLGFVAGHILTIVSLTIPLGG